MTTGDVGVYYDRLGVWNRAARIFGYGGGSSALTVHRALADPKAGGRVTFSRVHDLVAEQVSGGPNPRVLDAGCGLGGTMIALAQSIGATCTGLTLSATQRDAAERAAAARGLGSRVRALVQSYDEPPSGPFDAVVAIESLAHSSDPARSVRALSSVLAPGGRIVVVDDMPEPAAADTHDLALFKAGWQCPVLWGRDDYRRAFAAEGLELVTEQDLTGSCRPRARLTVAALRAVNAAVRLVAPSPALRAVMASHRGGLALERLLRDRLVRYRLIVARRPGLRVS